MYMAKETKAKEAKAKKSSAAKKTTNSKKVAAPKVSPEEVAIAMALYEAIAAPHDEESYKLTIERKPIDLWSLKVQNMRVVPSKQYFI